jgi:hypothetical protein
VFSLVCQVSEVPARLADPTYSELVPSDNTTHSQVKKKGYTLLDTIHIYTQVYSVVERQVIVAMRAVCLSSRG